MSLPVAERQLVPSRLRRLVGLQRGREIGRDGDFARRRVEDEFDLNRVAGLDAGCGAAFRRNRQQEFSNLTSMADHAGQTGNDCALAPGLYLVATPIGNLGDITLRALDVLRCVDRIVCEDTRQTQKLLNHFGISTPTISCHEHNEAERIPEFLAAIQKGERIAIVSDAGMPGISDPGMRLAAAAIEAGIAVHPIPGANAALSALGASGLNTGRFLYMGFLPPKAGARRQALVGLVDLGG